MGELKRYECGMDRMGITTFEELPTGEWVKHSDAQARIADLERAVEVLAAVVVTARDQRNYEAKNGIVPGGCVSGELEQAGRNCLNNPIATAALEAARRTK